MPDISKDPRYIEAARLFDMWEWGFGIPSDPHAKANMRHATGWMACTASSGEDFMEVVLRRYLGDKYRETARTEMRRIAQGAARNVVEGKE